MKVKKYHPKKTAFLSVYIILTIFLSVSIAFLTIKINEDMLQTSFMNIEEQLDLQKSLILAELDSDVENLELFAKSIAHEENIKENFALLTAGKSVGATDSRVYFLDETGQGYINEDTFIDLTVETYYLLLSQGKTIISSVRFNEFGSSFFIVAPIMEDMKAKGFILNEISTLYLENLLASGFDDMLYTYIVDELGNTIALNMNSYVILPSEPLRNILQRVEYDLRPGLVNSFDKILEDFSVGKSGAFEISHITNTRLAYYTPLGVNSWYLISFLPEEALTDTVFTIRFAMAALAVVALGLILLFALYISSLLKRINRIREDLIHELTSRIDSDPVTKLYTREETENRIATYLTYTHDKQSSALLLVDIDDFKRVNTLLGEEAGDSILHDAAQEIRKCFRSSDLVGRVDRNLFIILLRNTDDLAIITMKAEKILYGLSEVMFGEDDYLTASVGIAICPDDAKDFRSLYSKADAALYHVKLMGKDGYAFYDENLKDKMRYIELKGDQTNIDNAAV